MNKWAAYDMFNMRPSTPQEQLLYKNMLDNISIPFERSVFDMGDIEVDYCDICHKKKQVQRMYYHYGINCLCCGSPQGHFEVVRYCEDCKPVPPQYIQVEMRPLDE